MLKSLIFLFLFVSFLNSASISIITGIPSNMSPGDFTLLNYSLCLNTAQDYILNFNMTNTTYNFTSEGIEFNFSNCSYNSTERLYSCPLYGVVGSNKIEINLSVSPLIKHEDYIISAFIELSNEAEFGVCNSAPVVPPLAPNYYSGSGSGGGSFSTPRPAIKPKPVEVPKEEPKPVEVPKEEPKPVFKPKPVVPQKPPKIEPEKPKNASILEFGPMDPEPEKNYDFAYLVIGLIVVGLVFLGLVFWWIVLRKRKPPEGNEGLKVPLATPPEVLFR